MIVLVGMARRSTADFGEYSLERADGIHARGLSCLAPGGPEAKEFGLGQGRYTKRI